MNPILLAAREVQQHFDSHQWRFCIIGGIAVLRWGHPRATQDVDISLLTEFGGEAPIIDEILSKFPGRIADARQFALENRVVLAKSSQDVAIDVALSGFEFEEQVIERATLFEYEEDVVLRTAAAEDLIVMKAFAGRDQDWSDVRGILERQRQDLDFAFVESQLERLCEFQPDNDALDRFRQLR